MVRRVKPDADDAATPLPAAPPTPMDAILDEMRAAAASGDPSAWEQLKPRAIAALYRQIGDGPKRRERAAAMFDAYRLKPQLLPGAPPRSTPEG